MKGVTVSIIQILMLLGISVISKISCSPKSRSGSIVVSWDELRALNISCNPFDNCRNQTEKLDSYQNCDCDSQCAKYDRCCLDSKFRSNEAIHNRESNEKCLRVYGGSNEELIMVDSCRNGDVDMAHLCQSNGEESSDPLLMIPVTSTVSGIAYKNYFCSICNEDLDENQVTFWNIELKSRFRYVNEISFPELIYDSEMKSWMMQDEKNTTLPVTISVKAPYHLKVRECKSRVIATCAENWSGTITREKCKAYMAEVVIYKEERVSNKTVIPGLPFLMPQSITVPLWYRNPHCAICNFENVSELKCEEDKVFTVQFVSTFFVKLFVLEGKERKCGLNMVYDKFAKKCRCNYRHFTMKEDQCVKRA